MRFAQPNHLLRISTCFVLTIALAMGQAVPPGWQDMEQKVKSGDRVRVVSRGVSTSGKVHGIDGGSLTVGAGGKSAVYKAADIERLYRMSGKTRRTAKGTGTGAAVGIGAGALAGLLIGSSGDLKRVWVAIGAVAGGIAGAAAGGVIGATRSEETLLYESAAGSAARLD